jgi:hypothetical protein
MRLFNGRIIADGLIPLMSKAGRRFPEEVGSRGVRRVQVGLARAPFAVLSGRVELRFMVQTGFPPPLNFLKR